MDETEYYAGVMTGSSFDGVDAVMTAIQADRVTILAHVYVPYGEALRADLLELQEGGGSDELRRAKRLAIRVSDCCVEAVNRLRARPEMKGLPVVACGVHGQTVRHDPDEGHTTQLADWGRIAERAKVDVVGDLRSQDIALGGQGAPIAPAFHQQIFAHERQTRCALNIGGLANVTVLAPGGKIRGFDTGPGNTLMDRHAMSAYDRPYDRDGRIAASGELREDVLAKLLEHPYFRKEPPKSAGRDDFPLEWALEAAGPDVKPEDLMRTLAELTARTVADQIALAAPDAELLIACGGGSHNAFLMSRIDELLPGLSVRSSSDFGVDPNLVEAAGMAWYAYRNRHGIATDLRSVTGQKRPCILGALWRYSGASDPEDDEEDTMLASDEEEKDPFGENPDGTEDALSRELSEKRADEAFSSRNRKY